MPAPRLCCPVSTPLSPSLPPRLGTDPPQILLLPFVILQTLFLLPCGTLLSPLFAVWLCLSLCFHLLSPFSSSSSLHASPRETLLLTLPPASFSLIPSLHLPPPSISLQHLTPPLNPALSLPCLPRLFPSSPEHTHLFFFFLLAILPSFIPVIVWSEWAPTPPEKTIHPCATFIVFLAIDKGEDTFGLVWKNRRNGWKH